MCQQLRLERKISYVDNEFSVIPEKELEKRTKQKLHQLWGAYFTRPNFNNLLTNFKENVSSKVSSFKIIKRLLLNRFSFNCCLKSLLLNINFSLLNKYKQLYVLYCGFDLWEQMLFCDILIEF